MNNILVTLGLSLITFLSFAQDKYNIQSVSSLIEVNGTSSLHDWTSTLKKMSGSATFVQEAGQLKGVSGLTFHANIENLKSGKGAMDDNTYKAVNSSKYPFVKFTQSGLSTIKKLPSGYQVTIPGTMKISSGSRSIKLLANCVYKQDDWVCTGSHKLKMTDYGVEPPTAVFGTITTGDELVIDFKSIFVK